MTTKEQELKALAQIKKIVEVLGEDSYIGMAFEGCFEIAEENIQNDWGCSMKERAESAERNLVLERNRIMTLQKEIEAREKEIEELQEDCKALNDRINSLREDKFRAQKNAMKEVREVKVETVDGANYFGRFAKLQYFNNDGFKFVNVVQESGWTTSYKVDDLKTLVIE